MHLLLSFSWSLSFVVLVVTSYLTSCTFLCAYTFVYVHECSVVCSCPLARVHMETRGPMAVSYSVSLYFFLVQDLLLNLDLTELRVH